MKKLFKYLAFVSRAILILLVFTIVFKIGAFYGDYGEEYGVLEFFTMDHEYKTSIHGGIPEEIEIRTQAYNKIVNYIWFALGSLTLFFVFDYFNDPKEHFVTKIRNYARGVKIE